MEPKVNYITVGLFVIGLTAALVAGLIWLTASKHKAHETYVVYMTEAATGLSIEAPVKFNGVDVGFVQDIRLNKKNPKEVCLELSIETGTPINQDTSATLMVQGITGVTYVGLSAGDLNASPIQILPGESYPIIRYKPSLLVQLSNVLADVGESMKSLKHSFKVLLNEENQKNLGETLANLNQITHAMAKNSSQLERIIKETATTLLATQRLVSTVSQNTVPNLNQSLNHLDGVLMNMEQLTGELKINPSLLVRGKAPLTPGPGER